jgi:hypothetical protein
VTEPAFTGEQCGQPEIRELQTKQNEIAAKPAHEADPAGGVTGRQSVFY